MGVGFRINGLGLRLKGLEIGIKDSGFRDKLDKGLGFRAWGSEFRASGIGTPKS